VPGTSETPPSPLVPVGDSSLLLSFSPRGGRVLPRSPCPLLLLHPSPFLFFMPRNRIVEISGREVGLERLIDAVEHCTDFLLLRHGYTEHVVVPAPSRRVAAPTPPGLIDARQEPEQRLDPVDFTCSNRLRNGGKPCDRERTRFQLIVMSTSSA